METSKRHPLTTPPDAADGVMNNLVRDEPNPMGAHMSKLNRAEAPLPMRPPH
jgi:hypothetical protein